MTMYEKDIIELEKALNKFGHKYTNNYNYLHPIAQLILDLEVELEAEKTRIKDK